MRGRRPITDTAIAAWPAKKSYAVSVPGGFLRISDAVDRVAQGLWGGFSRPELVATFKAENQKSSVGFGPRKDEAGKILTAAAIRGKLAIYVYPGKARKPTSQPAMLPQAVVERLILRRQGLPDVAIHPSVKNAGGDFFRALQAGTLLVAEKEFTGWYRAERAKGVWPSQRSRLKPKVGRPSKLTDQLRNAIDYILADQGDITIAALRRKLVISGHAHVSEDTLARAMDQLFRETGHEQYRRIKRLRRKRS